MTEPLWDPSSSNREQEDHSHKLIYEPNEVEGECVLHSVEPVKLDIIKYGLLIVFSVLLLGIPILILFW